MGIKLNFNQQYVAELIQRTHRANEKWWISLEDGSRLERDKGELCMLIVSEFAEAMEGHRKNLQDDKLPHRKMLEVEVVDAFIRLLDYMGGNRISFAPYWTGYEWANMFKVPTNLLQLCAFTIKLWECRFGSLTEESVTASKLLCRIVEFCDFRGLDLLDAYEEKMAYNAQRVDHTHEHRKAEGGKKY